VIVPVWNTAQFLPRCIDSLIGQTYQNLEIILVDDGSPDNCGEICDDYASRDSRVRVLHTPNGGTSKAKNAGLDIASGEFVAFLDSDDRVQLNMYEAMYSSISKSNADMAVCSLTQVQPNHERLVSPPHERKLSIQEYVYDLLYTYPYIYTYLVTDPYTCFFRKSIIDKFNIRFPSGSNVHISFTWEYIKHAEQGIAFTKKSTLYYYFGGNPTSENVKDSTARSEESILKSVDYFINTYLEILPSERKKILSLKKPSIGEARFEMSKVQVVNSRPKLKDYSFSDLVNVLLYSRTIENKFVALAVYFLPSFMIKSLLKTYAKLTRRG
jgi:glycosyltransferase involved in cell wall biosynthesis